MSQKKKEKAFKVVKGGLSDEDSPRSALVFPNNIRKVREERGLTQGELGSQMRPQIAPSMVSKTEHGERRMSTLQLEEVARVLKCRVEDLLVVKGETEPAEVRRWEEASQANLRQSIMSGAAAIAYVLNSLRKKHKRTLKNVAEGIGVRVSLYHRIEQASRLVRQHELVAFARYYKMSESALFEMIEKRMEHNLKELKRGADPRTLMPQRYRPVLGDDLKWRRLGVFEKVAVRGSVRVVNSMGGLPVYGGYKADKAGGGTRYVFDRKTSVGRVQVPEFAGTGEGWFAVPLSSRRAPFVIRSGAMAYVNEMSEPVIGDLALVTWKDGGVDVAVVAGNSSKGIVVRLSNPEEELGFDDASIERVYRIAGLSLA